MSDITASSLETLLSALSEQLALRHASAHLVVIGGSGLLALGVIDRPTRDVDVVAIDKGGLLVTASPLPQAVQEAAEVVRRDFRLPAEWLNTKPAPLLHEGSGLPDGFRDRSLVRTFGSMLTIEFAGRLDQIFLKLYALATRREARDEADLRSLAATPEELQAAAHWAREHTMPGPFDEELAQTLGLLGVTDAGRHA